MLASTIILSAEDLAAGTSPVKQRSPVERKINVSQIDKPIKATYVDAVWFLKHDVRG